MRKKQKKEENAAAINYTVQVVSNLLRVEHFGRSNHVVRCAVRIGLDDPQNSDASPECAHKQASGGMVGDLLKNERRHLKSLCQDMDSLSVEFLRFMYFHLFSPARCVDICA